MPIKLPKLPLLVGPELLSLRLFAIGQSPSVTPTICPFPVLKSRNGNVGNKDKSNELPKSTSREYALGAWFEGGTMAFQATGLLSEFITTIVPEELT